MPSSMPSDEPLSVAGFTTEQRALISAEQAAETAQTLALLSTSSPAILANAGLAITNLVVVSQRTGLGGKTVLELEKDSAVVSRSDAGSADGSGAAKARGVQTAHAIRVGDIVRVAEQPKGQERKKVKAGMEEKGVEGVVVSAKATGTIQVALQEKGGHDDDAALESLASGSVGKIWVVKLANEVTYRRMQQTMERMEKMEQQEHSSLLRILLGMESPTPVQDLSTDISFRDSTLNDLQKDAVRFALASRELALIHGPPGTGKTYTIIELILQLLNRQQRVLVCGPSNISVDNIVERLAPHSIPILRLGHPARLLPSVLNHSLDVLMHGSDAAALVKDIQGEMDSQQASIKKTRNGRERRAIYANIKELRKEYRVRERQCVSNLVRESKVVLATLHGAGGHQLKGETFDVVIIDEASQALEAQSWIPLMSAKKVVLAGDHLQLPPTVKSVPSSQATIVKGKKNSSLETTMFSRLLHLHGPDIKRMLTIQYRMHETICSFPSTELYEGKLKADSSVAHRLLPNLPYSVEDNGDTREPLIFYDTQGGDFPELVTFPSDAAASKSAGTDDDKAKEAQTKAKSKSILLADSKSNPAEASLAARHVKSLLQAGVREEDIAVITPYNAQVSLLSDLLKSSNPAIELGSVDGFQGREKEAVVLSLVRSNIDGLTGHGAGRAAEAEVGFLAEKRRLNVAMTRPRRQLCVIGDSETVSRGSEFLKRWMAFLEESADLRYPDVTEVMQTS